MLIKAKSDGRTTGRLAIDGSQQPKHTYTETFAGTSCTTNRAFILSSVLADAAHTCRLDELDIGDFDIPGAFLQSALPRSATGGHQFVTRLPRDIPQDLLPYGMSLAEIVGSVYGVKQSNSIFDTDFTNNITSIGYTPIPQDPHTFTKRCPLDPSRYCHLNMHVDDGQYFSTSKSLTLELLAAIKARYGEDVSIRLQSRGICGVNLSRHSNHSVILDMNLYIMWHGQCPPCPHAFHARFLRPPNQPNTFRRDYIPKRQWRPHPSVTNTSRHSQRSRPFMHTKLQPDRIRQTKASPSPPLSERMPISRRHLFCKPRPFSRGCSYHRSRRHLTRLPCY